MNEKDICKNCGAEYGYHGGIRGGCPTYLKDGTIDGYSSRFEFCPVQKPKRTEWRVLPADKLVRVLVDGGWVPDQHADFEQEDCIPFCHEMWDFCEKKVQKHQKRDTYMFGPWELDPSWVEEAEVEDE